MAALLWLGCASDETSQTPADPPPGSTTAEVTSGGSTAVVDDSGSESGPADADSSDGPAPSVCGDGIMEDLEECDDGNDIDGDGCDNDCTANLDTALWQLTHAGEAMVRESGHGVATDSLGNVVVGGYVVDEVGDPDMWLAKYDPQGRPLWSQRFDLSGGLDDRIYGVAIDVFDNVVVVGDTDVAPATSDIWVARFDPEGDMQWSTTFDGPLGQNDGGRGVATDGEGNVAIAGFVRTGANDNDIFVAHLRPQGTTDWTDTIAGPEVFDDRGRAVAADAEGNVFVAGYVSHGGFDRNVWLRKYDPEGTAEWTEQWDSPSMADDAGFGVTVGTDGSVAVAGHTPVVADNQDIWLGRWDTDGELLWFKQFGGQSFVNDQGFAVAADSANNFIVAGFRGISETDSDIWMRKYDEGGNVVWSQAVAGRGADRDQATAIAVDRDDNLLVTGEIRHAVSSDGDIWLGKFGPG